MVVNKNKLKKWLRLFWIYGKMDFIWLTRDTSYALLCIFAETTSALFSVGGIFLLAVQFDGMGGMSQKEVLFMLGYLAIVKGIVRTFGGANNVHVSRLIGRGQLEHLYIQPVSLKMQLTTMGFCPFTGGTIELLGGIGLIFYCRRQLMIPTPFWWWLLLILCIFLSLALLIAITYGFSVQAFYAPVSGEEIATPVMELAMDLGKYPLSGMPTGIRRLLTYLLPVGIFAWLPSCILLGQRGIGSFLLLFLIVSVLCCIAGCLFKKGMNYYVRAGANRYVPYGFRN